jgi:hypothetical protein
MDMGQMVASQGCSKSKCCSQSLRENVIERYKSTSSKVT